MRIGIYYDNSNFSSVDCRFPEEGNPGIGGTEFCFISLAGIYQSYYPEDQVIQFVHKKSKLPNTAEIVYVDSIYNAIKQASDMKIDILVLKAINDPKIYQLIDKYKVKTVIWGHNFYFSEQCELISNCEYVKRNVFVGRQMYDRYIDHKLNCKSTYIYNMFPQPKVTRNKCDSKVVTYIGSLVPSKGFHILAKSWKKILRYVPDAQLKVIGSGKLYNENSSLGKYGLAESEYEKKFLKYLVDDKGEILNSVQFFGVLGNEKEDVILKTSVGIANPSGRTETFGLSAVDFESHGVPVVTLRANGFLDTVKNGETGLLFQSKFSLAKYVSKLMINTKRNTRYGKNGIDFAFTFAPEVIIPKWKDCFMDVMNNKNVAYIKPNNYIFKNFKYLRIFLRNLKKVKIFASLPALIDIETSFYKLVKKLLSYIKKVLK